MKIFIKYPTRSRPEKSVDTLKKYIERANDMKNIQILVSLDEDDITVTDEMYTSLHPNIIVKRGQSDGKISAINRDIPDPETFDILLLASDDMIPNMYGYDDVIRDSMQQFFPDTDGVLFFNDGYVGYRLNTLVICGSKYYQRFGYIYYPEYKSLYCDNEFMDTANRLGKQVYLNKVIIKHEHPANSHVLMDELYKKNEGSYGVDGCLYESRYKPDYDVSVLICTIPTRHEEFVTLLNDIENYKKQVNIRIEVLFDCRLDISIGKKRQALLDRARGLYSCFIDDDDKITPNYFQVIQDAINTGEDYDCIQLNGRYYIDNKFDRPFYHSLKYDKWSQDTDGYYRCPNHLNPIKTQIARKVKFHDISNKEDLKFSEELVKHALLKTEYVHDKPQYLYYFNIVGSTIVKPPTPKIPVIRWGIRR
jgi:hypothetical protein